MLRRSLAGLVDADDFERAGIAPESPSRAAERRRSGDGWPARPNSVAPMDVVDAPAKLTISLRVTGRRSDGSTCWTPRWSRSTSSDTLTFDDGDGLEVDRACRRRRAGRRHQPRAPGARAGRPARAGANRQAHPGRRGPRRRLEPTPPRSSGGPASTTSRSPFSSAPTSRSAFVAAGPGCTGVGEVVEPCPPRTATFTLVTAALRVFDCRGLPGVGRARRPDRSRHQRPRAGRARGRAAARASGGTASARRPASSPTSPGAARRGSSRGSSPVTDGSSCGPQEGAEARRSRCSLLAGSTLPAGSLEHLLVLLLAHALAPLLDQRTHVANEATGRCQLRRTRARPR